MKPPIYCVVEIRILPEFIQAARAQMRKLERAAREDPGCIQYHFLQDRHDETVFVGYGIWTTGAEFDRHMARIKERMSSGGPLVSMTDPDHPPSARTYDRI